MQENNQHFVKFFISRLKSVLNFSTDNELANFLEVTPQAISTWKKRNSIDFQLVFSKCPELDYNFLMKGEEYSHNVYIPPNNMDRIEILKDEIIKQQQARIELLEKLLYNSEESGQKRKTG